MLNESKNAQCSYFHQFHSNLLWNLCWKSPKGWHTNVAHHFTIHETETSHCSHIKGCNRTNAQAKRKPSSLSLVNLWSMSPCRWAGPIHTTADNTVLSANTVLVAYINSSSHPCIPTVPLLLPAHSNACSGREDCVVNSIRGVPVSTVIAEVCLWYIC